MPKTNANANPISSRTELLSDFKTPRSYRGDGDGDDNARIETAYRPTFPRASPPHRTPSHLHPLRRFALVLAWPCKWPPTDIDLLPDTQLATES
ncbi:hypothetical protein CSOJ01_04935 [Colletotrichum sojae]|uniref:Uncharacterized protein n=1 Tax=Colletotrichum sojae TaxID=2175907 RepID=A0A8H6MXL2_9PEZI|nr:hypothetical protein CSOJ01_04935 [Colletotrichum sojae]